MLEKIKNKMKYIKDQKIVKGIVEKEVTNLLAEHPGEYVYVIRHYLIASFLDFFYVLSHIEYAQKNGGAVFKRNSNTKVGNHPYLFCTAFL